MNKGIKEMTNQELANEMNETLNLIKDGYVSVSARTQAEGISKPTLQQLPYYIMLAAMCEEILQRKILVPDNSAPQTSENFLNFVKKITQCEESLRVIAKHCDEFCKGQDLEEAFCNFLGNATTEQCMMLLSIAGNAKQVADFCLNEK